MSPELITLAALVAPAAVVGPVCIAGHLITRRQDAALAAAFHADRAPKVPPGGDGEPLPAPEALADVLAFPTPRPGTEHTEEALSA